MAKRFPTAGSHRCGCGFATCRALLPYRVPSQIGAKTLASHTPERNGDQHTIVQRPIDATTASARCELTLEGQPREAEKDSMKNLQHRASRFSGQAFVAAFATACLGVVPFKASAQGPYRRSCEADDGHPCCVIRINALFGLITDFEELGRTFPEWEAVDRTDPDYVAGLTPSVILEGTVATPPDSNNTETGPHVSFEDSPWGHNSHDVAFKVRPDESYRHLLGIQVHTTCSTSVLETCPPPCPPTFPPCGQPDSPCIVAANGICSLPPGSATCDHFSCSDLQNMPGCISEVTTQDLIEVEWESGVGASNDDNPCQSDNTSGNSCGFFSAGHTRREPIWNWPTVGDHVHVEGYWVWDRGHPPAVTEIHPPRLVAIQRNLLSLLTFPSQSGFVVATKADVFASGDGGAYNNNRSGAPSFVRPVPMSEKDYTFKITHNVPPPTPGAQLHWGFVQHAGDSFAGDPIVTQDTETGPDGVVRPLPRVTVTLPWNSRGAADTAVFARSFYVWWATTNTVSDLTLTHGVAADYHPRLFKVTLDYILMNSGANDMLEPGTGQGDMELRVFVEAGGNWLFLNEIPGVDNILDDGLGDASDDLGTDGDIVDYRSGHAEPWAFYFVVPPGGSFRLHAGGWEADGVNDAFGKLINPNSNCDCDFQNRFNDEFGIGTYLAGGRDDPIGEVNHIFSCENADSELGTTHAAFFRDQSGGGMWKDDITKDVVDQNRVFQFQYYLQELSWQGASGTVPPGGGCDADPPAITINQPTATQYVHSATITLDYSAVDVGGSGVKNLSALMDGMSTVAGHSLTNGLTIDLLTEMTVTNHTFTVNAVDYVGNAGSKSVTFSIIVTPGSLKDDVKQFLAAGKITLGEGNSLLKLLDAAAAARAKGDCNTANKIYTAFINEVQAQSGKTIDPTAAQILVADAQYLIANCP